MSVGVIIQARMGSNRLPGKVLKTLLGRPVLDHVLARCRKISGVDKIIVATTTKPQDAPIVNWCEEQNVTVCRGSEDDVLDRYIVAARAEQLQTIIRITSDCPLLDGSVVQEGLEDFLSSHDSGTPLDYLSNGVERTYPRGYDYEIFTMDALERANKNCDDMLLREHVTAYMYLNPDQFNIKNKSLVPNRSDIRVTLDTEEDWQLIQLVFQKLYSADPLFALNSVLDLFESEPELAQINAAIEQKKIQ